MLTQWTQNGYAFLAFRVGGFGVCLYCSNANPDDATDNADM